MRKNIFFSFLLLISLSGISQDLFLLQNDTSYLDSKYLLEMGLSMDYRSNSLNNDFMDRMALGGFIDEELKDRIGGDLTPLNRIGLQSGGRLSYWSFSDSLFKNKEMGMLLQIEQRADGFLSFTDDFFNLMYRGNDEFIGEEADLSRLNGGFYLYQKYGVGLFHKKTLSSIRLSMVNGQQFYESQVREAFLRTDPNVDSISLAYNGNASLSDTAKTKFGQTNGIGAALDLKFNIPLKDGSGIITFELNNLGFIQWYDTSIQYEADSSFTYSGIDIQDLLDGDDNSFEIPSITDTLNIQGEKKQITTFLPGSASVSMNKRIKENNYLEVGIQMMGNRVYTPLIYVGYDYFINPNALIGAKVLYGGYSGFRLGGHFEYRKNSLYLTVGTDDLPGLFYRNLYGRGAYLSIGKFIGKK